MDIRSVLSPAEAPLAAGTIQRPLLFFFFFNCTLMRWFPSSLRKKVKNEDQISQGVIK